MSYLTAQYSGFSSDNNDLVLVRKPKPAPTTGNALVKVFSASVNPVDYLVKRGYLGVWKTEFPFHPGYDFSGVIESLPEGENGPLKVGEEVFGVNWGAARHEDDSGLTGGAFAEYILVPIRKLSKKPAELSHDAAAALALVGTTALQLLDATSVTSGSRVLIIGGATSVGALAIQLAKLRGAWVATTTSSRNYDYVKTLGADKLVNYNESKWDEDPELKGLDAVISTADETTPFARAQAGGVLKPTGAFATIVNGEAGYNPAGHPPLTYAAFFGLTNSSAVQDELARLFVSGALKLPIDEVFPFTEDGVRALYNKIESGKSVGKNVLKIVH